MNIVEKIAQELSIKVAQVNATITLLDDGATVPFIARYRKEATGNLDDTQLRQLTERLMYLRELEERRETILASIESQGKLTEALKKSIVEAESKTKLEDLYLPYKPKRRTKAQIAREAGLEPLALSLLEQPELNPEQEAQKFINKDVADSKAALDGARQILMESFSEQADLLGYLRDYLWQNGVVTSQVAKGKEQEGAKFSDYFEYSEAINKIPSHRALALFRGRNEGFLQLSLTFTDEHHSEHCITKIAKQFNIAQKNREADAWLWQTVEWTWKIKFHLKLELELFTQLRTQAEEQAIIVFKDNLKNLLMTAPAGHKNVLGLDPGLRTGVKVVAIDGTGKLLEYVTIFPHAPRNQWQESLAILYKLAKKHQISLVSIGNGTASRETDKLVAELISHAKDLQLTKVVVSEAGASVYSASELAANEFPDLDVSYRGAVSIARRLQDPLAELVKIDPKSIGVGQYQHDVNQVKLSRSLNDVLEDCVNAVGADVNTASVPLLASISGLNETVAKNIVTYRESHGRFNNRDAIKKVPRLGDKTFEQAIGFLRIIDGDNPLDASAVHPESYPVVEAMLKHINKPLNIVMGEAELLKALKPQDYVTAEVGEITVKDILQELHKPGRDPRPEFVTATFKEGVETLQDLVPDMQLEGVVTNVTNFGAFVDIGVHQDGLVHVSELANRFVKDANEVVKVGQIVKVRVLDVDLKRNRIQLSMKDKNGQVSSNPVRTSKPKSQAVEKPSFSALGDALKAALSE